MILWKAKKPIGHIILPLCNIMQVVEPGKEASDLRLTVPPK